MARLRVILLFSIAFPVLVFGQEKNRISLQAGVFHQFFDNSVMMYKAPINDGAGIDGINLFRNLLGGMLIDSRGVQYERKVTEKSYLSVSYMALDAGFAIDIVYSPEEIPVIFSKNIRFVNLNYTRKKAITEKVKWSYGAGINYWWGNETFYHYTNLGGIGEPRLRGFNRSDFGPNVRLGIEYSLKKWLSLYSNLDYTHILYLGAVNGKGENAEEIFSSEFGLTNVPSRHKITFQLGVGWNF